MTYVPTEYSIILEILFSEDNCTDFITNKRFENDCNSYEKPSINSCCQQILDVKYGKYNFDTCYSSENINSNYTHVIFHCLNKNKQSDKFLELLGFIFILIGIFIFLFAILKNYRETHHIKQNVIKKNNKTRYHQISINSGYTTANESNNQQYNTFTEHE